MDESGIIRNKVEIKATTRMLCKYCWTPYIVKIWRFVSFV